MFKRILKTSVGLGSIAVPPFFYLREFGYKKYMADGPRTIIGCNCGKVEYSPVESNPRMHVQCCCDGCRQREQFAIKSGKDYSGEQPFKGPIRGIYFGNSIYKDSVKGQELLKPFTLRDANKGFTFMKTDCCHTILGGWHPAYNGNMFALDPLDIKTKTDLPECFARLNE